ncbi:MAG: helix-turn-helix domain-containing protein [Acidimicrobiales bacterium]
MVTGPGLLKEALRRSGMTARELSVRTGVAEGRISDYLKGRHDPGLTRALHLVESTGFTFALVPDRDRNGIVLAELLDLADALAVGTPRTRRGSPPRFADLLGGG